MATKRALVNSSGSISEIATTDSLLANGFATPTGTTTQFLKADGTTDSTTYLKSNTTNALTTQTTFDAATTTDGVVISQSSSGAALRVTNTGTGNSFVVEDSANPDSTPFVIDASGGCTLNDLTIKNNISIDHTTSDPIITMNANAGIYKYIKYSTTGLLRWIIGVNASAESGSNVGSDFWIGRYADNGTQLTSPVTINRANGLVYLNEGLVINGDAKTISLGASADLQLVHDGTNSAINNFTGTLFLSNFTVGAEVVIGADINNNGGKIRAGSTYNALDATTTYFRPQNGSSNYGYFNSNGLFVQNSLTIGNAALATSATSGFLWIPSCAGTPTGAPTAPYTNASALVTDTTNGNLVHRAGSTWVTNVKLTGEGSALGWRDIIGVYVTRSSGTNIPTFQQVAAGFYWEYAYAVNDAAYYKFHINHDYAVGTNIFLHMHFMCSGTNTQPVVWQFTYSFAKGHNQANFDTVGTSVSKSYAMTTTAAYRHHIAEIDAGILSTSLEVDGILLVKCTRLTNGATENTDTVYGLCCDVHYQADRFATKNKTTNFYV